MSATNGITRYICQLRKLTLHYCRHGGSSQGARTFIEGDLLRLAQQHPEVVWEARVRHNSHPFVVAEFLNGRTRSVGLKNLPVEQIAEHLNNLRTSSGDKIQQIKKTTITKRPSLQGTWHPFLNTAPASPPVSATPAAAAASAAKASPPAAKKQ
eukprot:m.44933 g.44933  ORF g.44933 m.44933 type:complete len:154 (+) comp12385_c0_seq1:65-526(+)